MPSAASSSRGDDLIRRVVDSLLRGDCRGKALCAECLVKLAMDHLDKSYSTPEIGRMMDDVFSVPGPILRRSTSPCVVCLKTAMPCLAVPVP